MAKVTYIEAGGAAHHVDVPTGRSVLNGAQRYTAPGIDGDCARLGRAQIIPRTSSSSPAPDSPGA